MLLKLSLKLCLKKNPGEKQNGQLGELVLRSCDAFGECLKPQDPLIMIWLPELAIDHLCPLPYLSLEGRKQCPSSPTVEFAFGQLTFEGSGA